MGETRLTKLHLGVAAVEGLVDRGGDAESINGAERALRPAVLWRKGALAPIAERAVDLPSGYSR